MAKRDIEANVTITVDPSKTVPVPPSPDFAKDESLRVCTLNGRQYLVPDRAIKGDELLRHLTFLAGKEAMKGMLLILTRGEDGGRYLQPITASSVVGSTFAAPGTVQIAPPLTFYTILTYD